MNSSVRITFRPAVTNSIRSPNQVSLLHELRHPRVVLLLGVCTTGRLPLMVLEYMAGGSLYARIHDKTR